MLNSLLLAEVMADRGRTLGELVQELTEEFGPHFYGRVDLEISKDVAQRIVRLVARREIKRIAGLKVTSVDDLDGVKMRFGDSAGSWCVLQAQRMSCASTPRLPPPSKLKPCSRRSRHSHAGRCSAVLNGPHIMSFRAKRGISLWLFLSQKRPLFHFWAEQDSSLRSE